MIEPELSKVTFTGVKPEQLRRIRVFAGSAGMQGIEMVITPITERLAREKRGGKKELYSLSEITSRDQFFVREHAQEFRSVFAPQHTREDMGRAFGMLLDPQSGSHMRPESRIHISPAELGLIIKTRKELGFPPAPRNVYNVDAVEVGSFLTFMEALDGLNVDIYGLNDTRRDFLDKFAAQLELQIRASAVSGSSE